MSVVHLVESPMPMNGRSLIAVAVLMRFLLAVPSAMAADFYGEVVGILDGDTIEVLHDTKPERIRLYGIDCPERGSHLVRRPSKPPQAFSSVRM